ncbi:MAG: hypothetical protein PHV06_05725 [bacterium]|nr:hypothetical protein [bacterium]
MKKFLPLILVFLLFVSASFGEAVKVIMKDGTVNEGELLGINKTTVFIQKDSKVLELSLTDVKAVFDSKTHEEISIQTLQQTAPQTPAPTPAPAPTPTQPAVTQPPKAPQPQMPFRLDVSFDMGIASDNSLEKKLWPLLIYEFPTTPWNGNNMLAGIYGGFLFRFLEDFEIGPFFGVYLFGLGSQNSGVTVTGSYYGYYYTYNVEYDLPAGAFMYGLKLNMSIWKQDNMSAYMFMSVGMINLLCNYTMTVTSSGYNGNKRGTFEGSDLLTKVGFGLEVDGLYFELGAQSAKIKEITYTIDENDFYPSEVGTSGTLYDASGNKIPADFSCMFLNLGFKFGK